LQTSSFQPNTLEPKTRTSLTKPSNGPVNHTDNQQHTTAKSLV